jgi:hypothetical protein
VLFLSLISLVSAWDINNYNDRRACQAHSKNPKTGCDPKKTLLVDPVSPNADFKTVQSGAPRLIFTHSLG